MGKRVTLIVSKSGKQSAALLESNLDNVEVFHTPTIQGFIDHSNSYKYFPARILLGGTALSDGLTDDLRLLYSFLRDNSEGTEVVLLVRPSDTEVIEAFQDIFANDRYTYSAKDKATAAYLTSLVEQPLLAIKSSEGNLQEMSTRVTEAKAEAAPAKAPVRTSFLSGLSGGLKKSGPPSTTAPAVIEEAQEEDMAPEVDASLFDSAESDEEVQGVDMASQEAFDAFAEAGHSFSFPEPTEDFAESGSSESDEDEDFLSMGSHGAEHAETGFLNEEDDFATASPEESEGSGEGNQSEDDFVAPAPNFTEPPAEVSWSAPAPVFTPTEQIPVVVEPAVSFDGPPPVFQPYEEPTAEADLSWVDTETVITIVTGTREADTANYVIGEAAEAVENGESVLVIDLDLSSHNVLSNIDLPDFLQAGVSLQSRGVYSEDGIDFRSNGYSASFSPSDKAYLQNELPSQGYSKILVDCPIDGLSTLTDLFPDASILLVVDGSYQGFVRTVVAMEGVNSSLAEQFYHHGRVALQNEEEGYEDDLVSLYSTMVIGKVDWLATLHEGSGL